MRLGLFVAMAGRRGGGPETYELGLIRELVALGQDHEYHVFCSDPEAARSFEIGRANVHFHVLWPRVRLISYLTSLPLAILRTNLDLLHATTVPSVVSPRPYVLTVHDIGMFKHPEFYDRGRGERLRFLMRHGIKNARLLICPTETTRDLVADQFRVPAPRLAVIPHGISERFRPIPRDEARDVLRKYALGDRYLLFTGKLVPHKNILRILEAFDRFRRTVKEDVTLVMSGRRAWAFEGLDETIARLELAPHLRELGYIDANDLPALQSGAEMLVFPSLYEGFGLPVIEAMACGTPVITSNIACLREVSGGASLTVDPYSVENITDGMSRIWTDPALRARLVAQGRERAAQFSWRRTARETLATYVDAVG